MKSWTQPPKLSCDDKSHLILGLSPLMKGLMVITRWGEHRIALTDCEPLLLRLTWFSSDWQNQYFVQCLKSTHILGFVILIEYMIILEESSIIVIAVMGPIGGNESYMIYDIGICIIPRYMVFVIQNIYFWERVSSQ